ncbi:hypothetical protein ACYOEI_25970, partial [Singulisphaera rosea]
KSLDLRATGDVGSEQVPLAILLHGGKLTGTVGHDVFLISNDASTAPLKVGEFRSDDGDVTLVVPAGDIELERINVPYGTIDLTANLGSIVGEAGFSQPNLAAKQINVSAVSGSIGSESQSVMILLTTNSGDEAVTAEARDSVWLSARDIMRVHRIVSRTGDVNLEASRSITGLTVSGANVSGADVSLTSTGGSIGTESQALTVKASGLLETSAYQGVFVTRVSASSTTLMSVPRASSTSRPWAARLAIPRPLTTLRKATYPIADMIVAMTTIRNTTGFPIDRLMVLVAFIPSRCEEEVGDPGRCSWWTLCSLRPLQPIA